MSVVRWLIRKATTMKTKTNISTTAIKENLLNKNLPIVISVITALLLAILFIGLTNNIDTGINITQKTVELRFLG